jgi:hypothetical protein
MILRKILRLPGSAFGLAEESIFSGRIRPHP